MTLKTHYNRVDDCDAIIMEVDQPGERVPIEELSLEDLVENLSLLSLGGKKDEAQALTDYVIEKFGERSFDDALDARVKELRRTGERAKLEAEYLRCCSAICDGHGVGSLSEIPAAQAKVKAEWDRRTNGGTRFPHHLSVA